MVKISVNRFVQSRIETIRNEVKAETQRLRENTLNSLEEIFNSTIEKDVYIGPYTRIGNDPTINRGEIENSIITDNCHIDIDDRITDSLIGPNSTITSNKNTNHHPTAKNNQKQPISDETPPKT